VAVIPDSVYGAVLLSVIDFFLSFVVISFIGFILALFPCLNRTGALQRPLVAVSVMPARDENTEHVAVIAAAIYAMLGVWRIVHIGEARPAPGWTLEHRVRVHTSHAHAAPAAENKAVEQLGSDEQRVVSAYGADTVSGNKRFELGLNCLKKRPDTGEKL
jgi:hypothetical protein